MNRRKTKFLIAVLAVILVGSATARITVLNNNQSKETQYLSASWDYNYSDIKEISKASNVIALVKVDKPIKSYEMQGIPLTEYSVQVVTPVFGTNNNENLTIVMTGEETASKIIEVKDDPLLQSGEEFLVFCKRNSDGTLKILSGPQGRLAYSDGKLNSLNLINRKVQKANNNMNITVVNADADNLINEIKSYVEVE